MASLFNACKSVARYREGGTFNIGGYDIDIEYYNQQSIQDDLTYGDLVIGDDDESKIVLFADSTITIPEGWTMTPKKPKKSLVIYCNTLINNGTISMYQKAPNVLPHDYYIIEGSIIGANRNIVIPAYADNAVKTSGSFGTIINGTNGANGTNRQCGSGGTGSGWYSATVQSSGSGYAFGGGAGAGGFGGAYSGDRTPISVNSTYPMRGGQAKATADGAQGGVGNPIGVSTSTAYKNNFGCGGRIIIFCVDFINNGTITVNGTATLKISSSASYGGSGQGWGGASGAGAVDLFYNTLTKQGTITADGGANYTASHTPGKGGNGSITLTPWSLDKVVKEERKKFTKNNWIYLMNNYSQRLKDEVI